MANIKLSDLALAGLHLFADFEEVMDELNEDEFLSIKGGARWICTTTLAYGCSGKS